MSITHTISVLELLWTASALFGLLFTGMLLLRTLGDRRWLYETNANGDRDLRRTVAMTSILIFAGGVCTQMSYLAVGVLAMTQENGHLNKIGIAVSSIFLGSSIVGAIMAGVIYTRRTEVVRRIVEDYVRRDHAGEPGFQES